MVTGGLTLALDAAASIGTVAVLRDGVLVAERTVEMRSDAEERYFPAVLDTLREAGAGVRDLSRVVCGAGPGSFTSLRVCGAIAKGIALGADLPLFAVPSLALIVASSPECSTPDSRWLATLDALRGDRYVALVIVGAGGVLTRVEALGLVPVAGLPALAQAHAARTVGPDVATRSFPHASGLVRCLALLADTAPVDLASWEPVYGRLAEAQVRWEATHGRRLEAGRSEA